MASFFCHTSSAAGFFAIVVFALICSCGSSNDATAICVGSRPFPVTAVNDDSRAPLPSPIIVFEPNGLSEPSPDPKAAYSFGGQGDSNGLFSPPLACGRWGVHVFATGFFCQSIERSNGGALEVGLLALSANDLTPVIASATWSNDAPTPGFEELLTVTTTAPSSAPKDKVRAVLLSATDSSSYRAIGLTDVTDPSTADGITQTWRGKLLLPGTSGDLIYAVVAATQDCRASKVMRLPISISR